jgi:inner membrane protease subunit 2
VTVRTPTDPTVTAVKRVIGVAGDRIRTPRGKASSALIPDGKCWVESDNGEVGRDSNSYGPVPVGLISATVTAIVYPIARQGWLESLSDESRVISSSMHSR